MPGLSLGEGSASPKLDTLWFSSIPPNKSWYKHSI